MAFASIGTLGSAQNGVSSSSFNWTTTTNNLDASEDRAVLTVVTNNITTTDGETNNHTSVTGGNGVWTKRGEYTNGEGTVDNGVTVSQWVFRSTGSNPVGTVFAINLSGAVVDKAAHGWKFTVASGFDLGPSASFVGDATDASNGFGSAAHSGLSSIERLYIRSMGKEANTTTTITPSTSFTRYSATTRSRNAADAVCAASEFRIRTSTGETSNPTLAVSGDTAAVFNAFEEVSLGGAINGTATGSIAFTGTSTGAVTISGTGSGDIAFSGSSTGTSLISGSVSGSFLLSGSATGTGATNTSGSVSGSFLLSGSATGAIIVSGVSSGSFGLVGSSSGTVRVSGSVSGSIGFTGTASGGATSAITASSSGSIAFTGSSQATVRISGTSTGSISFSGSATGTIASNSTNGVASGQFLLTGSATVTSRISGQVSGNIVFIGAAIGSSGGERPTPRYARSSLRTRNLISPRRERAA